jgi:hypothetical protein
VGVLFEEAAFHVEHLRLGLSQSARRAS